MTKLWHIIWYEYRDKVFRWGFLLGLLTGFFYYGLMLAVMVAFLLQEIDPRPVGLVNLSDLPLHGSAELPDSAAAPFFDVQLFKDESQAAAALRAGEIQHFYIFQADYPQTNQARLVTLKYPKLFSMVFFQNYILNALLTDYPSEVRQRILTPPIAQIESVEGNRSADEQNPLSMFGPILISVVAFLTMLSSSGYLLHGVMGEKENRLAEILVSSTSTNQIMMGKTIAYIAVGATQSLLIGLLMILPLALLVLSSGMPVSLGLDLHQAGLILLIMFPSILMLCLLMASIGAFVYDPKEAGLFSILVTLPASIPYFLIPLLISNPNSFLAVAMSVFPLTAPLTLLLRLASTQMPVWQLAFGIVELFLCAFLSVWIAGRAFRVGMLRYGRKPEGGGKRYPRIHKLARRGA